MCSAVEIDKEQTNRLFAYYVVVQCSTLTRYAAGKQEHAMDA
jgi:hypothetical protein